MGCSLKYSGCVSARHVTHKPVINNSDMNLVNGSCTEVTKVLELCGNTDNTFITHDLPFPLTNYRQHHPGQRLRGHDADWLWSNRHQDPPHQVLRHPTFTQGQPHKHGLPALADYWKHGGTSGRGADGVGLIQGLTASGWLICFIAVKFQKKNLPSQCKGCTNCISRPNSSLALISGGTLGLLVWQLGLLPVISVVPYKGNCRTAGVWALNPESPHYNTNTFTPRHLCSVLTVVKAESLVPPKSKARGSTGITEIFHFVRASEEQQGVCCFL